MAQVAAQLADTPLQARGAAQAEGVLPSGKTLQTPSALAPSACVQTLQSPVHAESQQTPSEQKPLAQSPFEKHGALPTRTNTFGPTSAVSPSITTAPANPTIFCFCV